VAEHIWIMGRGANGFRVSLERGAKNLSETIENGN
jgi:hypothetical protein